MIDIGNLVPTQLNRLNPKESENIVSSIMNTQWDFSDDFDFSIIFPGKYKDDFKINKDIIRKSVISVELPVLSSQEIDNIIGGTRRVNVKMQELFRFNVKFRDFQNGVLKRIFTILWVAQQFDYFDNVKSTIKISKSKNGKEDILFLSEDCVISQISSQTFSNEESNVVEFDVTFVTPSFTNTNIVKFGSDTNYNSVFSEDGTNSTLITSSTNNMDIIKS